jgi:hypothetical protein
MKREHEFTIPEHRQRARRRLSKIAHYEVTVATATGQELNPPDVCKWPEAAVAAMQRFGSYRGTSGLTQHIANATRLMWWTVPAPGQRAPIG